MQAKAQGDPIVERDARVYDQPGDFTYRPEIRASELRDSVKADLKAAQESGK